MLPADVAGLQPCISCSSLLSAPDPACLPAGFDHSLTTGEAQRLVPWSGD